MTVAALFHRPPTAPDADRDLLRRFADRRDDGAFAALVQRYGRLVFATCLRVLSHRADAEDAYQATFLVLARRATAIRSDEKLAGWLHTVAVRTATEVRRIRDRSKMALSLTLPAPTESADPLESRELATVLDEELAKLPDHYRLAVVLCELNGIGRKAAAKELGIAEGTLSSRLAKARKLLADRLAGRGFGAVSAGALTAALASSAVARVPATGLDFGAADGILNVTIHSVADTVVKAMFATKLKAGALVAVLLALAGGVVWTTAAGAGPGEQPAPAKETPDPAADLVAQLGGKEFAEREAAEKALKELGAAAFAAVTAGLKSDNPEIVRRCQKLLPAIRAMHLARPESDLWKKFAAITGDTVHAKALFLEMASDPARADILTDGKAAAHYPAFAEQLLKAYDAGIEEAWERKRKRVREQTGRNDIQPLGMVISTKLPSRGEATLLFFLGSSADTARAVPTVGKDENRHYSEVLKYALTAHRKDATVKDGRDAFPPEARKLFAAWLGTRTDAKTVRHGMDLARTHELAEALPVARAVLADDKRTLMERAPALHVVALLGSKDDIPRVKPFLDSEAAFFHSPEYTDAMKPYPCLVQVRDVAHAVVGKLLGAEPLDLGYDFCVLYKTRGAEAFKLDLYLGFTGDAPRAVAHAKVRGLLKAEKEPEQPKKDDPAEPLVAQLGSKEFAEREAAEKALKELGAAAFAAVTAGLKSDNPEVVRRCQKLLPAIRAAWLARPESEVWKRFTAVTGDTPHARELFLEMAAEPERAASLMAENPTKEYAAVVEKAVRTIRAKYDERERESQRTGIDRLGRLLLLGGGRGEAMLLLFLGSSPETADAAPKIDERDRWLWHNCLQEAFMAGKPDGRKFPPEVRQLIAAWLTGRTDQKDVRAGLAFARFHRFDEVVPVARAMLADDRRTTAERTPALYALAQMGTKDDLKLVVPFLESDAEYHRTKYTHTDGKSHPLTVEVRDVAHAAVGKLLGADLADLGFEFCTKGEAEDGLTFRYDHFAGFTTDAKRAAAHANVRKLLKNAPVPKDFGPPKPKKLSKAAPPPAELRELFAGPSVLCTAELVGKLEARAAELAKKFPAAEDRARVFQHTAKAIANGRLREDHARVTVFAERALELSRDPETRWRARSLHASAIYISGKPFAEGRRLQADILLAGYVELLAQDLPDQDPEWPTAPHWAQPGATPAEQAEAEAARWAHSKACAEVEFVMALVFGRKVLLMQLRDLFKPDGADELRALAAKTMTAGEVKTLMARVLDEK